jgi:hypothetical protein
MIKIVLFVLTGLLSISAHAFGIALTPLHTPAQQVDRSYGRNISLQGSPRQIANLRRWIAQIASVPKGLDTLIRIQGSGHKLFITHSAYSLVSSGRTAAPATSNLINGEGESVDIAFNADIPDQGSHQVYSDQKQPIEYTAAQNLYHELAHALHMMNGSWRYFASERQAIEEENEFRRQLAELQQRPFAERVYVSGEPICPLSSSSPDESWNQDLICK